MFCETPRLPVDLAPGIRAELSIDVDPAAGKWTDQRNSETKQAQRPDFGSENGYQVRFTPVEAKGTRRLDFSLQRKDSQPFKVKSYGLRVATAVEPIRGTWYAHDLETHSLFNKDLTKPISFESAANTGMPFILCAGSEGKTVAAAGWIDQVLFTRVSARRARDSSDYVIDLIKTADQDAPLQRTELKDGIFARSNGQFWFDTVRDYARTVDLARDYHPNRIPSFAWEPVYCSWYPYRDDIFEKRIWDNAVLCKELGISTFLIDAGWDMPIESISRSADFLVAPLWGDPDGPYGDYTPSKERFPDFAGLIRKMQAKLGLKVELWIAPFWVGKSSAAYDQLADAKLKNDHSEKSSDEDDESEDENPNNESEEDYNLCPSHPKTAAHLRESSAHIMRDFRPDGIWMDFLDGIPRTCTADHKHVAESLGAGFNDCARAMFQTITQAKPDAIIEYRIQHANLNNKPFANVWQTTDTPYDYEMNRLLGINLRTFADGMVIKTDPAIWRPNDSDVIAAKSCSTMIMGGVPSFSLDLPALPEKHRSILKSWINFYRTHREELLHGEFRPFGSDFASPEMKIEGKTEAFVYLKSGETKEVALAGKQLQRVWIFNCTDIDWLNFKIRGLPAGDFDVATFSRCLNKKETRMVSATEHVDLDQHLTQGGTVMIELAAKK